MIAQVILTVLLSAIVLYAWCEQRRSPVVAAMSLLAATSALYFVWTPTHASGLAHWVGIGRGVDLVIYLWVVISLLVLLNLHLKLRGQLEMITVLARGLALAQVSPEPAARPGSAPAIASAGDQHEAAQDHTDSDRHPQRQRLGEHEIAEQRHDREGEGHERIGA
jgi:hypothetical protein